MNENTLVSVHCYSGDIDQVAGLMPFYKHHQCPVVVISPEDAPVAIPNVECRHWGHVGYIGQVSLDRQRMHLELLLTYPHEWFLAHDSDSICISPQLPDYLYRDPTIVWSNEVNDWRTHKHPYPRIAMQPPYFMHRSAIEKMLAVPRERVMAHPITPFIDYYMLQLTEEAKVPHRSFPDGCSWATSDAHGKNMMIQAAARGKIFLHSVKRVNILTDIIANARRTRGIRGGGRKVWNPGDKVIEFRGSTY